MLDSLLLKTCSTQSSIIEGIYHASTSHVYLVEIARLFAIPRGTKRKV